MAEAEREREKMTNSISTLESKISDLEVENSRTTEENKGLLGTLEDVNINMCLSESRVRELQEELDAMHVSDYIQVLLHGFVCVVGNELNNVAHTLHRRSSPGFLRLLHELKCWRHS